MDRQNNTRVQIPRSDIYKDKDKFIIRLELPGVNKEGLDINIEDNLLKINGHKTIPEFEDSHCRLCEISDYDYRKELSIDNTVDREKIEAELVDGILNLMIGLKEAAKPQKITINVK